MASTEEKQDPAPQDKQYYGSCHCGAYKFSYKALIPTAEVCNCSICYKNGYRWLEVNSENYQVLEGKGTLKEYRFGDKKWPHYFCPTCGSSVLYNAKPGELYVNANMFEDLDLALLKVQPFDGIAKFQPPYKAPQPPEQPEAREGLTIYNGSCHCGAVTYTLQTEPFDRVKRCDCSICKRNNYAWLYPLKSALQIHESSDAALSKYLFGPKRSGHMFCSTCGVSMFNFVQQDEVLLRPVNARTINGVNVDELPDDNREIVIKRKDGGFLVTFKDPEANID